MNHGTRNSRMQDVESQLIVPNVSYTNESQSHQSFLQLTQAATETRLGKKLSKEEISSWVDNFNNEISEGPEVATPPPPQQQGDGVISWMQNIIDEFLHDDNQQLLQPQQAAKEATPCQPQPAINLFHQPQAEDALWAVLEPPVDLFASNNVPPPLEPPAGMVEPSRLNNNHHFFTAPQVQNFAPIFNEPADSTWVVAAVEENQEESCVVKDENQVVKQGDGSSTPSKKMRKSHNKSERRRRDKISERMNHLRELVPGCSKIDRASVLDQTCTYLKSLQNHVNMLSLGSNMRMGMSMGMVMGMNLQPMMVPFPALVPGPTLQNPANNTAAHLPSVADMYGQYLSFYPTGYLQAENKATSQLTKQTSQKGKHRKT